MVRTGDTAVSTAPTLKRENFTRTKHDSAFSDWKILIGACDWEDYLLNKEGAERYRTHNLPNCASCPGLYELGITVSVTQTKGKVISKLHSKSVIPVYLGQADNVRTRLQQYGRDGDHLENGWSNGKQNDRKFLGLFSDIFSYGFAIAFRWAPMESKKDAEKTESQLLKTFDYAWNRGMNGERRPSDIHKMLDDTAPNPKRAPSVFKMIRVFPPKEVGLRIKHCDPPALENGSSFYTKQNYTDTLAKIFKFGRSGPILVSKDYNMNNDNVNICGVSLGHGSVCIRPPVEGRKRCVDHKGMKVNAHIKPRLDIETGTSCNWQKGCEEIKHQGMMVNEKKKSISSVDSLTCAAITLKGSCCRRKPSNNSKFCWQHETTKPKMNLYIKPHLDIETGTSCNWQKGCEEIKHQGMMVNEKKKSISSVDSLTCAAITLKGSCCRRKPSNNSKFCWQHETTKPKMNL